MAKTLFSDTMPAHAILSNESESIKFASQMTLSSLLTQGRQRPTVQSKPYQIECLMSSGRLRVTLHCCTWRDDPSCPQPLGSCLVHREEVKETHTGKNICRAQELRLRSQVL